MHRSDAAVALAFVAIAVAIHTRDARADVESAWAEGRPARVCTYSWDGFQAAVDWWAVLYTTTPGFTFVGTCADPDLTLVLAPCYWFNVTYLGCYTSEPVNTAWAPNLIAMRHEIGHALGLGHHPGYTDGSCWPAGSVMDLYGCPGQDRISPEDVAAVLLRIVARAELRAK